MEPGIHQAKEAPLVVRSGILVNGFSAFSVWEDELGVQGVFS